MGNIHVVGPNEALVVSGGCCGSSSKRYVVGGWIWTCYLVNDIQKMSLEVFTLNPQCSNIETHQGVPISVTGIAQCKLDKAHLDTASQMFLGKEMEYIKSVVLQTIEGHLRAIIGTLTMERIYSERNMFAELVSEMVAKDLGNLGVLLLSFTLKEITDEVEYLASLGRKQIADVKKQASIGVAAADKERCIKQSESQREVEDAKFTAETAIENASKELRVSQCAHEMAINKLHVATEMTYELELAKLRKELVQSEMAGQKAELEERILIQTEQIEARKLALRAELLAAAEAEAYRVEKAASARKEQILAQAEAEAKRTRLLADAEAANVQAIGEVEAEQALSRGTAFKLYRGAATLQLTLQALPKLAAELAAPLANVQEIVLLSGSSVNATPGEKFTAESAQLAADMPPTIKALTGIDFSRLMQPCTSAIDFKGNNDVLNQLGGLLGLKTLLGDKCQVNAVENEEIQQNVMEKMANSSLQAIMIGDQTERDSILKVNAATSVSGKAFLGSEKSLKAEEQSHSPKTKISEVEINKDEQKEQEAKKNDTETKENKKKMKKESKKKNKKDKNAEIKLDKEKSITIEVAS